MNLDINTLLIKPMALFEQIARSEFEARDFAVRWPRLEEELTGCTLKYEITDDSLTVQVKGLKDKAEYFNDHYARAFSNHLVGIANRPKCEIEFLQ